MGHIGTPRKHKLNVYWTQSERKSGQPGLMKDEMKIMINRSNRIKITYNFVSCSPWSGTAF